MHPVYLGELQLSSRYLDGVVFLIGVNAEAAPLPLVGFFDQAGFHGIAMHVTNFFNSLCFCEDVEVVVAGLPPELLGSRAGKALLDYLDSGG